MNIVGEPNLPQCHHVTLQPTNPNASAGASASFHTLCCPLLH